MVMSVQSCCPVPSPGEGGPNSLGAPKIQRGSKNGREPALSLWQSPQCLGWTTATFEGRFPRVCGCHRCSNCSFSVSSSQCGCRGLSSKAELVAGLSLHLATWSVFISPPTCLGPLIAGIFPGTCCVDAVAELGHVPGGVAEANFHGKARDCTRPVSPWAFSLRLTLLFQYCFRVDIDTQLRS